jgi:hypothetical protein
MFDQDADILNEHAVVFLNNNHPILDFYHSHLVFNLDAVYAEGVDDPPLLYYTVTAEIPIVADVEGMINVDLALNYEGPPLHYQPGNPACASTDLLPPHQDYFLDEFSWDLDEQNRHVLNQQHVSVRQIRLPDVVADVSGLFSPYGDWPFDATHLLFNHISGVAFQKMNDINCNVNFQFLAHQNISIIANDDARYVHSFDDFDPHQILHYPEAVYKVTAGIPFTSSFTTTPMEWCSDSMALQSTLSKQKHSFGAMLQLYKSRGGKIGNHPDFLYPIPYGSLVAMNRPADAFTGRVLSPLPDNTSNQPYESCLIVSHDEPFSFNILSVTRNINVNE